MSWLAVYICNVDLSQMRIIYKLNYEKYRLIRSQGISAKARKKLI